MRKIINASYVLLDDSIIILCQWNFKQPASALRSFALHCHNLAGVFAQNSICRGVLIQLCRLLQRFARPCLRMLRIGDAVLRQLASGVRSHIVKQTLIEFF